MVGSQVVPSVTESLALLLCGSSQTHILMSDNKVYVHGSAVFYPPLLAVTQVSYDSHKNLIHFEDTEVLTPRHSLSLFHYYFL